MKTPPSGPSDPESVSYSEKGKKNERVRSAEKSRCQSGSSAPAQSRKTCPNPRMEERDKNYQKLRQQAQKESKSHITYGDYPQAYEDYMKEKQVLVQKQQAKEK